MIAHRCPRAEQGGFTLIETLVAFTIATLLLSVLLAAFAGGINASRDAATRAEATELAVSTLEAMGSVDSVRDGARFDRAEGRFHIAVSVQRYGGEGAPQSQGLYVVPYDISVRISWPDGGRQQSMVLRTLQLGRQ
jgi:general secretion pathway protein I